MPKRFAVGLPDTQQRKGILRLILPDDFSDTNVALLAESTSGCSGSDLKEICRDASMNPLREYMKERGGSRDELIRSLQGARIRSLELRDFYADDDPHSMLHIRARRDSTVGKLNLN